MRARANGGEAVQETGVGVLFVVDVPQEGLFVVVEVVVLPGFPCCVLCCDPNA